MNLGRIHRLLQLIGLLQAGRGYNSDALAQACGVSRRTVFRDLDLLRLSGVPLSFDEKQQRYRIPGACLCRRPNSRRKKRCRCWCCATSWAAVGRAVFERGPHRRGEAGEQAAGPAPRSIARGDGRSAHRRRAGQSARGLQAGLRPAAHGHRQPPQRPHPLRKSGRGERNRDPAEPLRVVFQPA